MVLYFWLTLIAGIITCGQGIMKVMFWKLILVVFGVFCVVDTASAQADSLKKQKEFKNSIIFSATDMFFPDHNKLSMFRHWVPIFFEADQLAIYAERRVYRNWSIAAGYSAWNETSFLSEFARIHGVGGYEPFDKVGSLQQRYSYKMRDVFVCYKYNKFKKHKIKAGLGLSYTYGINEYVDSVYHNPSPPFDGIIFLHDERHSYWGLVPLFSYDYLCLRRRVGIGADFRVRKYFGIHSTQIDYGAHVALNF